ncbi:hypothetical protein [Methylobacterium sp. GC_Met_2]|uniref:hypothetical protein n=1 Tax=Methylobacterium sp. GC_Met_2 TaxID=2937376 RepID=UPI00226B5143|nr:hypothetical protein [Methylobacterium sp. GC_Met_2]
MTKQNTAKAAQPATDLRQRAARARDAAGRFIKRSAPVEAAASSPAAAEIMEGWRAWDATLGKPEGDPEADAAYERAAERRDALLDAAEAMPPTPENVLAKALAICWLEYVSEVSPGKRRSEQPFAGRIALDIHEAIIGEASARTSAEPVDWYAPPPGFMASPAIEPFGFARIPDGIAIELGRLRSIAFAELNRRTGPETAAEEIERLRRELHLDVLASGANWRAGFAVNAGPPNLVSMLDLGSASMEDLRALRETADMVGGTAFAVCWQDRCKARGWRQQNPPADQYNVAGQLMQWLGDALTDVETAVDRELDRRTPSDSHNREIWLTMRAWPVINDGDPDAIEAFARELLDHAAAERRGH